MHPSSSDVASIHTDSLSVDGLSTLVRLTRRTREIVRQKGKSVTLQGVQSYCFCLLNMQICNVLLAVAVVVAKAP